MPQENELASYMHNITLVCTHHSELGKCNLDELYKIIESINPDVIFEELSPDLFNIIYSRPEMLDEPPEVKSIKRYLRDHDIKHIPVDINIDQNLSDREIQYMLDTFNKYDAYKKIEDEQIEMTAREGFDFLNSKRCLELSEEKKITEKNLMEFMINKDQLLRIQNLFYEEQDKRENQWLQNIYDYSKENCYNKAIFTVGAGHRKSMIEKVQEYERKDGFKLNWTFYDGVIEFVK